MSETDQQSAADRGSELSVGLGQDPERAEFELFVAEWTGVDMRHHESSGTWGLGLDSFAWACWKRSKAAERERWRARVEEAFRDGFYAPRTYNDRVLNTADEAWEEAKAGLLKA